MKNLICPRLLIVIFLVAHFISSNAVYANVPCDNIVTFTGERIAIEDCSNPFGPPNSLGALEFRINDETIRNGDSISVPDISSVTFFFDNLPRSVGSIIFYKHVGDDYQATGSIFEPQLDGPGTYTLVVQAFEEATVTNADQSNNLFRWLIPIAYAQSTPPPQISINLPVQTVTFTISEDEIVEDIDPLLLKYAPILRMHEDEEYYPMRMEDFVRDSALWDQSGFDSQLFNTTSLTPEKFIEVIEADDTNDYYLAYSDPDNDKSLDLDAARKKYGDPDPNDVTIYVHRMNDFAGDDEYIVLQYWQFYAMNNWEEVGGFNNHEGDFESVFIFLDADTEEPKYVAYSAHHNDGDPFLDPEQYDSVRRNWNSIDVTKTDNRVISYVSLGSHANYPNNGNEGSHPVPFGPLPTQIDQTSDNGTDLSEDTNYLQFNKVLLSFEGTWGTPRTAVPGGSGPKGPQFLDVGDTIRFLNPIEWAGIDNISELALLEPVTTVPFIKSGINFNFTQPVPAGTEFTVTPYEEPITFGVVPEKATLLPTYWDIESSLPNNTFEVEVTFSYDPNVIDALEGEAEDLVVFFFNPESTEWEPRESSVNTAESTVSFISNTFSRYALGLLTETQEEPEPKTLEELLADVQNLVKEAELSNFREKRLLRTIGLAEKLSEKDHPIFKRSTLRILKRLERVVKLYVRKGHINTETSDEMIEIFNQIRNLLNS
jgi:hypothetical protein